MQQYIRELLGAAETREVDNHSQDVLHSHTSGDHVRDGWQKRTPDKAFLNIADLEDGMASVAAKAKILHKCYWVMGEGGGSTYCFFLENI